MEAACDDDGGGDLDDDHPPAPGWSRGDPDVLDEAIAARGAEVARALAHRAGFELETADPAPLACAARSGDHYSHGVPVLGWDARRAVVAARFAAAPALLVCDLQSDNDEPFEDVLESRPPEVRLVPFTGPDEVARVLLEEDPGLVLRAVAAGGQP